LGSAVLEACVPSADAAQTLLRLFFCGKQVWALIVVLVADISALAVGLELLA